MKMQLIWAEEDKEVFYDKDGMWSWTGWGVEFKNIFLLPQSIWSYQCAWCIVQKKKKSVAPEAWSMWWEMSVSITSFLPVPKSEHFTSSCSLGHLLRNALLTRCFNSIYVSFFTYYSFIYSFIMQKIFNWYQSCARHCANFACRHGVENKQFII